MRKHRMKCWPAYFQLLKVEVKTFEVREKKNRDFQIGDLLQLEEWDPRTGRYSGEMITMEITFILEGGQFGINQAFVVMSVKLIES